MDLLGRTMCYYLPSTRPRPIDRPYYYLPGQAGRWFVVFPSPDEHQPPSTSQVNRNPTGLGNTIIDSFPEFPLVDHGCCSSGRLVTSAERPRAIDGGKRGRRCSGRSVLLLSPPRREDGQIKRKHLPPPRYPHGRSRSMDGALLSMRAPFNQSGIGIAANSARPGRADAGRDDRIGGSSASSIGVALT